MAKTSTIIKKVRTDVTEFKSEGVIGLDGSGNLVVETEDYGVFNLIDVVNELGLLNQLVKVQISLKVEDIEEISPLEIGE